MTVGNQDSGYTFVAQKRTEDTVEPNKIYAYMNKNGMVMRAEEYEHMKSNPKTAWVIDVHWANAIPLGVMK